MRVCAHVGEVEHELDVVHAKGMLDPVGAVAVPTAVQVPLIRRHVARADFAKAHRAPHHLFDSREDFGMPNDAVKFGRGDQRVVIRPLVMAIRVPAKRAPIPVAVKQREKFLALAFTEQVRADDIPMTPKIIDLDFVENGFGNFGHAVFSFARARYLGGLNALRIA